MNFSVHRSQPNPRHRFFCCENHLLGTDESVTVCCAMIFKIYSSLHDLSGLTTLTQLWDTSLSFFLLKYFLHWNAPGCIIPIIVAGLKNWKPSASFATDSADPGSSHGVAGRVLPSPVSPVNLVNSESNVWCLQTTWMSAEFPPGRLDFLSEVWFLLQTFCSFAASRISWRHHWNGRRRCQGSWCIGMGTCVADG